jgi:hypothetical protein
VVRGPPSVFGPLWTSGSIRSPTSWLFVKTAAETKIVANRPKTPPCLFCLTCLNCLEPSSCRPPSCRRPTAATFPSFCCLDCGAFAGAGRGGNFLKTGVPFERLKWCWALSVIFRMSRGAQIPFGWPSCPACWSTSCGRVPGLLPQSSLRVATVRLLRLPLPAPRLRPFLPSLKGVGVVVVGSGGVSRCCFRARLCLCRPLGLGLLLWGLRAEPLL